MGDLVERDGIYYKKFTETPFTGKVTGKEQGRLKNGEEEGEWVEYHDNGQLMSKVSYKNGEEEGKWIAYYDNGQLWQKGGWKNGKREGEWVYYDYNGIVQKFMTGTFKDGRKVSD